MIADKNQSPLHRFLSSEFGCNHINIIVMNDNAKTHDDIHQFNLRAMSSMTNMKNSSSHHRRTMLGIGMSTNSPSCRWSEGDPTVSISMSSNSIVSTDSGNSSHSGSSHSHGSNNNSTSNHSSNSRATISSGSSASTVPTATTSSQPSSSLPLPLPQSIPMPLPMPMPLPIPPINGSSSNNNNIASNGSPTMPTRKNTPPQHVLSELIHPEEKPMKMPIRKNTPPQSSLQGMINRHGVTSPSVQHKLKSRGSYRSSNSDVDSVSVSNASSTTVTSVRSSSNSTMHSSTTGSGTLPPLAPRKHSSTRPQSSPSMLSSSSSSSSHSRRSHAPFSSVSKALGLAKQRCQSVKMADELRQIVVQAIEVAEEEAMSMRSARRSIDKVLDQSPTHLSADLLLDDDSIIDPRSAGLDKRRTGLAKSNNITT